ncbi:MAG: helix-turn-helix domain-containing protein [Candidatus Bathyarchaeota archaeon]|nr:MAG: helix-turn-helix domain-containing protein [Candidatus Bathyarchaeota archaeon]
MGRTSENLVAMYDQNVVGQKFIMKDKGSHKSLRIIEDAFEKFDLSKNEIRIFLFLARSGFPRKARDISDSLSIHRTETYRILRTLERRGLISSMFEKPMKFLAVPFDEAMDHLIEAKRTKIDLLEREKKDLLNLWSSFPKFDRGYIQKKGFQVLEGKEQIALKSKEMLRAAEREIDVLAPESALMLFYHWGITDELEETSRTPIEVRLMTDYSSKNRFFVEKMQLPQVKYVRAPDIRDLPGFITYDQTQVLLCLKENAVDNGPERQKKQRIHALWTNYGPFVKILRTFFLQLWNTEPAGPMPMPIKEQTI